MCISCTKAPLTLTTTLNRLPCTNHNQSSKLYSSIVKSTVGELRLGGRFIYHILIPDGVECAGRFVGTRSWLRRRRRMVGPSRPVFVLFGSSIVQFSFSNGGWGAALADIYARKADIVLRGYSSWNSTRGLKVIDEVFPKDAPVQPSLVIVYFGGNDSMGPHPSGLGPHVPLPEYVENMKKIATHLKGLSEKTRIIFLSSPPVNEERLQRLTSLLSQNSSTGLSKLVRTNELCRKYSEACIQLCKEMDVKVIDLWSAIQKRDDWRNACFTDGIHFSAEGSKIVVDEILKVVKEADWEPCLYWKSRPSEFADDSPYDLPLSDGATTFNVAEVTLHRDQWN